MSEKNKPFAFGSDIEMTAWAMLPNEDRDSYQAFLVYRDSAYPEGVQGRWVRRRFETVAERLGLPLIQIDTWANAYRWRDRVREYDLSIDHALDTAGRTALEKAKRAQARRLAKLAELGEAELDRHLLRHEHIGRTGEPVVTVGMKDLADILERVDKMETRLATVETPTTGGKNEELEIPEDVSLEELEEIERIRLKFRRKPSAE